MSSNSDNSNINIKVGSDGQELVRNKSNVTGNSFGRSSISVRIGHTIENNYNDE